MDSKLTGMYLGTVLKHLSHGCLKVFVPSVFPQSLSASPDRLPTCMQIVPQFAGNENGNGVFSYPNIGSTVVCMFANGDQNLPFTFGSIQGGFDAKAQYQLIDGATNHSPAISSNINNIIANDDADISSTSKMHRITTGNTSLTFNEEGQLSAQIEFPLTTHVEDKAEAESFARLHMMNKDGSPEIIMQTIKTKENIDSKLLMDASGNVNIKTTNGSNTCFIDMKTNGVMVLDVNGESTIILDGEGNIKIDSSKSIKVTSKEISIEGSSSVKIDAPNIDITASGTMNISSPAGDCVIDSTSLNNHTHPFPYMAGISPSSGTTLPPNP